MLPDAELLSVAGELFIEAEKRLCILCDGLAGTGGGWERRSDDNAVVVGGVDGSGCDRADMPVDVAIRKYMSRRNQVRNWHGNLWTTPNSAQNHSDMVAEGHRHNSDWAAQQAHILCLNCFHSFGLWQKMQDCSSNYSTTSQCILNVPY